MRVVLVRHTSVAVPKGTCYGWTDVPVSDSFIEEAALAQTALRRYEPFDAVFSSPLTRARLLASYCGHQRPVLDERLKELNMGEWEMKAYDEISDPYVEKWYNDFLHLPTPGGESFADQYMRVADFLDELRTKDFSNVAVFAHGGVLACAGIYAGLFAPEAAFDNLVPYGGIEVVDI